MSALTKEKDCGCGCGGANGDCCGLECLVQPRFFCGQLLADQDLTAMVDWVKAKSALSRFRHGWGVVCGLDVRCGKRGKVTIAPGYALDCCGRDIVVCKDAELDLSHCWQRPDDPCAVVKPGRPSRATFPGGGSTGDIEFGGLTIPIEQVQAFDISIRYSESQSDARSALARGGCGGAAGCEYTRVQEGFDFDCKPVDDVLCASDADGRPRDPRAAEWERQYRAGLTDLLAQLSNFDQISEPKRKLAALLGYVHSHQPPTFCFVHEWLCDLQSENASLDGSWFQDAAFWLVQDWRNQYLRLDCTSCGPDTGVPLARVWIWRRRVNGQEQFSTLHVVPYAPFRRELARDEHPVPAGFLNAAPYIWQPRHGVETALHAAGFNAIQPVQLNVETFGTLTQHFNRQDAMFLRRDDRAPVLVYWTDDRCGQQRVVSLARPDATFDQDTVVVKPQQEGRKAPQRRR